MRLMICLIYIDSLPKVFLKCLKKCLIIEKLSMNYQHVYKYALFWIHLYSTHE